MHAFEGTDVRGRPTSPATRSPPASARTRSARSHPTTASCTSRTGRGALHFADGLLVRDGELALMPDELMDDPTRSRRGRWRASLELLELDFDALLFAHSDPIVSGGNAKLEAFTGSISRSPAPGWRG